MSISSKVAGLYRRAARFVRDDVWEANTYVARQMRKAVLVVQGFKKDRCFMRSSALAYTTLLSIVPLFAALLLVFKTFGAGDEQHVILDYTERFLAVVVPGATTADGQPLAAIIASHIELFANRLSAARVGGIGVVVLFFTAISILVNVEQSLNDIWGVRRGRSLVGRVVIYWAMITLIPLLTLPALSTQFIAQSQVIVDWIASLIPLGPFARMIEGNLIPVALMTVGLVLLYVVLPNVKVRIRSALVGALVAAVLINLDVHLFGMLLTLTGKIDRLTFVYGILAIVPLLLLFAYAGWAIVLLGAEIAFADQNAETYYLEQRAQHTNTATRERLAMRIMYELAVRHARDEMVPATRELQSKLKLPIRIINETIAALERAGLVVSIEDEEDRYLPAHELAHIRMRDVILAIRSDGDDLSLPDDDADRILAPLYRHLTLPDDERSRLTLEDIATG